MNATAMTNLHPVDELADVRLKIKHLDAREIELKKIISDMMGEADSLGGNEYIARQTVSERAGAIDTKAMEAAGIDVEKYRKKPTTVYTLRIERRESEVM